MKPLGQPDTGMMHPESRCLIVWHTASSSHLCILHNDLDAVSLYQLTTYDSDRLTADPKEIPGGHCQDWVTQKSAVVGLGTQASPCRAVSPLCSWVIMYLVCWSAGAKVAVRPIAVHTHRARVLQRCAS